MTRLGLQIPSFNFPGGTPAGIFPTVTAMAQAAAPMQVQWRAQAGWIDEGLAAAPFLNGERPGLSDVAAYMNIWWLGGALPETAARLTQGFERLAPRTGKRHGGARAMQ